MTTRRPQQAAAFVLSLVLTLAIFSGVSALSAPDHAHPMLAQWSSSAAHG
jgi:hypothetical protein